MINVIVEKNIIQNRNKLRQKYPPPNDMHLKWIIKSNYKKAMHTPCKKKRDKSFLKETQ